MKITADNIGITVQQTGMLSEGGIRDTFLEGTTFKKIFTQN